MQAMFLQQRMRRACVQQRMREVNVELVRVHPRRVYFERCEGAAVREL